MNLQELFNHPRFLSSSTMFWMLLPLCLVVSIVYKTIRINTLGRLWREIPYMFLQITLGLVALGLVAWLIVAYWP